MCTKLKKVKYFSIGTISEDCEGGRIIFYFGKYGISQTILFISPPQASMQEQMLIFIVWASSVLCPEKEVPLMLFQESILLLSSYCYFPSSEAIKLKTMVPVSHLHNTSNSSILSSPSTLLLMEIIKFAWTQQCFTECYFWFSQMNRTAIFPLHALQPMRKVVRN